MGPPPWTRDDNDVQVLDRTGATLAQLAGTKAAVAATILRSNSGATDRQPPTSVNNDDSQLRLPLVKPLERLLRKAATLDSQ